MSDLTTQYLYRKWAGVDPNTGTDNQLSECITLASKAIETFLDRRLALATRMEWLDGHGEPWILLPEWPISALNGCAIYPLEAISITNATAKYATVATKSTGLVLTWVDSNGDTQTASAGTWATYKTMSALVGYINGLGAGWTATVEIGYSQHPTSHIRPNMTGMCHEQQYTYLYIPDQWTDVRIADQSDRTIERVFGYPFPCGRSNIFMWFAAGYTLPVDDDDHAGIATAGDLPADIISVANLCTKALIDTAGQVIGAATSEGAGNYSYSLSPEGRGVLSAVIQANGGILQKYRKVC